MTKKRYIFYIETGGRFRQFIKEHSLSSRSAAEIYKAGGRQPDFIAVWMSVNCNFYSPFASAGTARCAGHKKSPGKCRSEASTLLSLPSGDPLRPVHNLEFPALDQPIARVHGMVERVSRDPPKAVTTKTQEHTILH
jgi:hypothetical protein